MDNRLVLTPWLKEHCNYTSVLILIVMDNRLVLELSNSLIEWNEKS